MALVMGIDTGAAGAIAVVHRIDDFARVIDMPYLGNGMVDRGALAVELETAYIQLAVLERQQAHFNTGRAAAFKLGRQYGTIETMLAVAGIQTEDPTPQQWKKEFGLIGKDKRASVAVAQRLFPALAKQLLVSKDGRSEALLMAEWGRRRLLGLEPRA